MSTIGLGANGQTISIVLSLLVVLSCYLWLSIREGNYVNVLTPVILFSVPSWYLLELVYGSLFGFAGSVYAYGFCYTAYATGVMARAIGYVLFPKRPISLIIKVPVYRIPGIPLFFLIAGAALYAPVVIQYRALIFSPRDIYTATRSGFGVEFFLSSLAVYIGFILLLFRRPSRLAVILYAAVALAILYLHGSKIEIFILMLIGLYYAVFVLGKAVSLKNLVVIGVGAALLAMGLFYLTFSAAEKVDLATSIASYADYTRNAALVIDDKSLQPQLGRLSFETSFYTMIPRALFPNKPQDYGPFWLTERYFPERYLADTGAPDFGLGLLYADFGIFSLIYYAAGQLLSGVLLRLLISRLRKETDAGAFLLLLVLLQVPLIPVGGTVPFLVYYALAHVMRMLGGRGGAKSSYIGILGPRQTEDWLDGAAT